MLWAISICSTEPTLRFEPQPVRMSSPVELTATFQHRRTLCMPGGGLRSFELPLAFAPSHGSPLRLECHR